MKKIILFTPNGYIGGYIKARVLKEKQLQLYTVTRDSNLSEYRDNYDVMVYSAGITSARNEKAGKYVEDNVVTAVSMVNFCQEHSVKRIIYLSTDEIYGMTNVEVVTDKSVMVNPNLYATTKYLAEKIIIESGIPYFILRLPGVVGGIWGKNFMYSLMERIGSGETVELYNMDKEFNNIVDVDDLTEFIMLLCSYEDSGRSEILLLGNTEKRKLKEIVYYIKELSHSSSKICNAKVGGQRYFTLDVAKAIEYGYSSKEIETIIGELYQIQKRGVF